MKLSVTDEKRTNYFLRGGIVIVLLLIGLLEIDMAYFDKAEDGSNKAGLYSYHAGDVLSFAEEATANAYCVDGFYDNEGTHTWTAGNTAKMIFDLDETYENLLLKFSYIVYAPPQRVYVFANGEEIANFTVTEDGNTEIPFSGACVENGRLKLEIVLPDAVSPKSRGESEDLRLLSLGMLDCCISDGV